MTQVGRKEQERTEEITDRGNVGGYHDGNPIYRVVGQNVDRQNVDRQNVDRHNVEQTKCRTDKMSNRQNVDRQNAEQTKCRQFFFFTIFFFLKFFYAEKQCGRQFWNAVEREPVETRVLNPTASEAS